MRRRGCDVRDVWNDEVIAEIADLMVYQSIRLPAQARANVMAGVENVIIDPRYAACEPDFKGLIVVSMGGSDPHDLTPRIVEAVKAVQRKAKVIVGPAFSGVVDWSDDAVEYVMAPDSLLPHLQGASLLIGSLGMTAYEAAAAGVPALLYSLSDDHERTAIDLQERGAIISMGKCEQFAPKKLIKAVRDVFLSAKSWGLFSAAGRDLVDGHGVERVADRIMELIG